jgi:outer membrane protein OmpA-like peptidoglycan-associated protein
MLVRSTVSLATLGALISCSSLPASSMALGEVRQRHAAIAADPDVNALATEELRAATASLRRAEQAEDASAPGAVVDHLAYLTEQRVKIAELTAQSRSAERVTAQAGQQRDAQRLAMRTEEANRAQQQLAMRTEEANRAQQQLATAQRSSAAQTRMSDERIDSLEAQLLAMHAQKTERGMVVTLSDVLFSTGGTQLSARGEQSLMKLAELLKRYPESAVVVEGHTDSTGSSAGNLALSDRRAREVVGVLVGMGIEERRLEVQAHGQDDPVATNSTAAGRQMNRRVELVFRDQR